MRVEISHTTRIDYDAPVVEGVMEARLGPYSDVHQQWGAFSLRVTPTASARLYTDGFGNTAHLVTIARPHPFLELVTRGEVRTTLRDPFQAPGQSPRLLTPAERVDFLSQSTLVRWDADVAALAAGHTATPGASTLDVVQRLMAMVFRDFTYRQAVTTVTTSVAEVLANRAGVCQDFAHVLIALCRSASIPARYVSGYIVAGQPAQTGASASEGPGPGSAGPTAPTRGAGASHAWVEAYLPTHGWRGFDPTNNLLASEHHVKMAIGRDYADVPPTRGTFRGTATEQLQVTVTTRILE